MIIVFVLGKPFQPGPIFGGGHEHSLEERLSDAPFLGNTLDLLANISLSWIGLTGTNTLVYLAASSATKKVLLLDN